MRLFHIWHALVLRLFRQIKISFKDQLNTTRRTTHDGLTGLHNRVFLKDWLYINLPCVGLSRRLQDLTIVIIDLDKFKNRNDEYGHDIGDELLIGVADRLCSEIKDGEVVARLGGDEFALILPNQDDVYARLFQIAVSFSDNAIYTDRGIPFIQSLSIGYYQFTDPQHTSAQVLKYADLAMYMAKHGQSYQKGKVGRFTPLLLEEDRERHHNEFNMRLLATEREFEVSYMPIVELSNNQVVAFESLLHPAGDRPQGYSAEKVIEVLDELGHLFDFLVIQIEAAGRNIVAWSKLVGRPIGISVNITASQVSHKKLIEVLRRVIDEYQINGSLITLEVTEGQQIYEHEEFKAGFKKIRELGCRMAIDDFGTANSDTERLGAYNWTDIKYDKVWARFKRDRGLQVFRGTSNTCHALEMRVVGEWVETPHHAQMAREIQCDRAQGSFYGETHLPEAAVPAFLANFVCSEHQS